MKNSFLSILILIFLLSASNFVVASCPVRESVEKESAKAALIFIGTAIKITHSQLAAGERASGRRLEWIKRLMKTDVVTFQVVEAFKGVSSENIDIATSAEGDAGYTFEGGTWLTEGRTYLVYANRIIPAGTIDEDDDDEKYSPAVRAEFRRIQKSFPADLAAEINEYNGRVSEFYASVCGRTAGIEKATEDVRQMRKMFPQSKKYNSSTDETSDNRQASIWQRLLNLLRVVQISYNIAG